MRRVAVLFIFLCIFLLFLTNPVFAQNNEEPEKIKLNEQLMQNERENIILIKYGDTASETRAKKSAMLGVEEQSNVLPNVELLRIKEGTDVNQLVDELCRHEFVETVELNHVFYTMENTIAVQRNLQDESISGGETVPCKVRATELPANNSPIIVNDIFYEKQWWLESINVPAVWQEITNSKPIIVAVIDSGIDPDHEDLKNKLAPGGYNFIFDNHDIYDISGHGTAVSGIIAAEADNYKGIAGVAGPFDVKVLPLQAGFFDGTMYTSDIVRAIMYAIDHDADVINLSAGSRQFSNIVNIAIQEAISRGITVVASAGNAGNNFYFYPASLQNVISVGAISPTGEVSRFSSHNDKVDFAAPGECIFTTLPDNAYEYMEGTSFSTAIVSGVVSLMKSVNPSLTSWEIVKRLAEDSLDKGSPGKDDYYGHGLINVYDTIVKLISDVDADYIEFPKKVDVPINKSWQIAFNSILNSQTVSNEQVYIKDSKNNIVYSTVDISKDGKSILITPLRNYDCGQEYCLYIESQIESDAGIKLKKPVRMKFTTGS